jgi:hypothetical protein
MTTNRANHEAAHTSLDHTDSESQNPTGGDDERENREQIARTGEPQRDALGNADGAS